MSRDQPAAGSGPGPDAPTQPGPAGIARRLDAVRRSTRALVATLEHAHDSDVRRPTRLPGWTNGHLLTHLARSAEGQAAILDGARRGLDIPVYPHGDEGRSRDIEDGARRDAASLAADVAETAGLLDESWSAMDAEAWTRTVHPRGAPMVAHELVSMRWADVEIHRIDLVLGHADRYGPDSWPEEFTTYLLDEALRTLPARIPDGLALELSERDGDWETSVGAGTRRVRVSGPRWALASWLVGRPAPAAGVLHTGRDDLPTLPPWR